MSKITSALKKISDAQARRPASRSDSDLNRDVKHVDNQPAAVEPKRQYQRKIEVDHEVLAAEGVAITSESEQELRDEMRQIKWPVLANAFGEQSKMIPRGNVVMVTSATSGEGKTFTAINLAMSIAAEKDVDVLLVDTDIAKAHATELLGMNGYAGMIEYLSGEVTDISDVIVGCDVPGLCLLPAGRADEHASELIASKRMEVLVTELSERFPKTVLLFDTSPILQTNESQVLSRLVGQILLVVAANKTPRSAVADAISLFAPDAVVNIIFNGVTWLFRQKDRYGSYYGYQTRR